MQWICTGARGRDDMEGAVDVNTLAMDLRMGRCQNGEEVEVVIDEGVVMLKRCCCF
jgi:hypothetical protein